MGKLDRVENPIVACYAYGDYRIDIVLEDGEEGFLYAWLYHTERMYKLHLGGGTPVLEEIVEHIEENLDYYINWYNRQTIRL